MVTVTAGGGIDWALIAAIAGNGALLAFAWRQFSEMRREARLSRRPVVEIVAVRARDVSRLHLPGEGRRAFGAVVTIRNVGEGRAVDIDITARLDGANGFERADELRALIAADVHASTRVANLAPGEKRKVTLRGAFTHTLEEHPIPVHFRRMAWVAADLTYADVYEVRRPVSEPSTNLYVIDESG